MVFFCCDACGESLKKNQVEKHSYRCRTQSYSCLDCNEVFSKTSYAQHLKCITENQKYGGKNYIEKEAKGEAKQNAWLEQVERAIEAVQDPNLKGLLSRIAGFGNIPRKEAKFVNFLVNSIRIHNRTLCVSAWNAIAEEAKKIKEEEEKQKADTKVVENKNVEEKCTTEVIAEEQKNGGTEEGTVNTSFKWKKSIKRKLKEAGGEMKLKKLRKVVQEEFNAVEGDVENFDELFEKKLAKIDVTMNGKTVSIAA